MGDVGRNAVERNDAVRVGGRVLLREETTRRRRELLVTGLRLDRDDPTTVAEDEVDLAPVLHPPMEDRLAPVTLHEFREDGRLEDRQ